MYRLIVNADDYGYTRGINYGILDCFRQGVVNSVSMFTNMPAFSHGVELARQEPSMSLGVHLNLSLGRPLLSSELLMGPDGNFLDWKNLGRNLSGEKSEQTLRQVRDEWLAQLARFMEARLVPTHLDSHHHIHTHPLLLPVVEFLSLEFGLPVRIPLPRGGPAGDAGGFAGLFFSDYLYTGFYKEGVTETWDTELFALLKKSDVPPGTVVEMVCHPGYLDLELAEKSGYSIHRMRELRVLLKDNQALGNRFTLEVMPGSPAQPLQEE